MNTAKLLTAILLLAFAATATQAAERHPRADDRGKPHVVKRAKHPLPRDTYFHRHGYERLQIPPGHYPPPGACRIWYPGRPAGHQPPAGPCARLDRRVPPGAWLIRHPAGYPDHVQVNVYSEHRRGGILIIGEFEIGSGTLVRIVLD